MRLKPGGFKINIPRNKSVAGSSFMKQYNYDDYWHYLITQINTNRPRVRWTVDKASLRAQDIKNIQEIYKGKKVLCLGCRHDAEVDDFSKNGFKAKGIDILPTKRQIVGDINKLENYFAPESFDTGYSCHSLEHTNNPRHFLKIVRKICTKGLYLVIPIRKYPDIEEPIFLDVMKTKKPEDLKKEIAPWVGDFEIAGFWERNNRKLISGPEMAFALKWQNESDRWDRVYENISKNSNIWKDLDLKYYGASPYIVNEIKKLPKSAKILDAGCGDGRNLLYLAGLGYIMFGIDISEKAIKTVKRKLKTSGINAGLETGDLYSLPYKNNFFDAAYYDFTNVHIENPERVLSEFRRVLKPGGLLLFETTSKQDPLYKGKNKYLEDGFYFRFYSRREAVELVEKYFRINKIELNTIWHQSHGKGYAKRKNHYHKSYLITLIKK